jgi:hypothetical protein
MKIIKNHSAPGDAPRTELCPSEEEWAILDVIRGALKKLLIYDAEIDRHLRAIAIGAAMGQGLGREPGYAAYFGTAIR